MNIRAITGFLDPGWPLKTHRIENVAGTLHAASQALSDAGYEVQTLRLATPPPAEFETPVPPADRPDLAAKLEAESFVHGVDYVNIGPALPDDLDGYAAVPDVLAAAQNVFCSGLIADPEIGVSLGAARACAEAILATSTVSPDGFTNLRFAGLANVGAGTPFFPAAYHRSGPPCFAIATEAADLVVDSLREVTSLATARRRLISMVEAHAAALTRPGRAVEADHGVRFTGIDFSLAPYPEPARSLGTALEQIGGPVGRPGSTAAAAFVADSLDQARIDRIGFSGLFLPVLEDTVLAQRAADGSLTVESLLLLSTVCGAGLDTVPLPGDSSVQALTALLADLGSLALRHNKPLTARLMPIPGKSTGDEIHFDFPYFADSRVMRLPELELSELMGPASLLNLSERL